MDSRQVHQGPGFRCGLQILKHMDLEEPAVKTWFFDRRGPWMVGSPHRPTWTCWLGQGQCKGSVLSARPWCHMHSTPQRAGACGISVPHLLTLVESFQRPYFWTLFLKSKTKLFSKEQNIHVSLCIKIAIPRANITSWTVGRSPNCMQKKPHTDAAWEKPYLSLKKKKKKDNLLPRNTHKGSWAKSLSLSSPALPGLTGQGSFGMLPVPSSSSPQYAEGSWLGRWFDNRPGKFRCRWNSSALDCQSGLAALPRDVGWYSYGSLPETEGPDWG